MVIGGVEAADEEEQKLSKVREVGKHVAVVEGSYEGIMRVPLINQLGVKIRGNLEVT